MTKKIRLGDIATLITKGTTPTTMGFSFVNVGINFVKIESISENGVFLLDKFAHITNECNDKLKRSQLQENDILFSIAGAIGRSTIVPRSILPANVNQALAIIRIPQNAINLHFVLYALQSQTVEEQSEKQKQGVAQLNLSLKNIGDILIPLVSYKEQDEIVKNLTTIDTIITLRKEQKHLIDQLVKSRFIEMFGDPQSNPHGYRSVKLSTIATYFNGLTYKPENVVEEGTIVLRSSNIQNNQLDFKDIVRVACFIKERFMVQKNDILMCSRNGSAKLVGKVALIKGIQEPMSFGAFMMIIRSQYFGYLMTYFQMEAFRRQLKTSATTTINQITGGMLDEVTIPLPPMSLVEQFTTFVSQVDKSKLFILKSIDRYDELKYHLNVIIGLS